MGDPVRVRWMIAWHAWTGAEPAVSACKDNRYLTFAAGARIAVVEEREKGGWWAGRLEGRLGWFPSAFCMPEDDATACAHARLPAPLPIMQTLATMQPGLLRVPQQHPNGQPWSSSRVDSNSIMGHSAATPGATARFNRVAAAALSECDSVTTASAATAATTTAMSRPSAAATTTRPLPLPPLPSSCPSSVITASPHAARTQPTTSLPSGALTSSALPPLPPQVPRPTSGSCLESTMLVTGGCSERDINHELENFPKQPTKLTVDSERVSALSARIDVWAELSFADLFADTAGGAARCGAVSGLNALRGALALMLGGLELLLDELRAAGATQQLDELRRAADGFRLGLEIASLLKPQLGATGLLQLLEQLVSMVSSVKVGHVLIVPALVAPAHGFMLLLHRASEGEALTRLPSLALRLLVVPSPHRGFASRC